MKKVQSSKGFTLVEIMIVTVIIGLLAAMAVPMWMKIRSASQEKIIFNNLRQLSSAAQQYFMENGVSTAAYTDLVGANKYLKVVQSIAHENYPAVFNHTDTCVVATGSMVPGKPDITYSN
jgi:type IV pilus assembly protein PilA